MDSQSDCSAREAYQTRHKRLCASLKLHSGRLTKSLGFLLYNFLSSQYLSLLPYSLERKQVQLRFSTSSYAIFVPFSVTVVVGGPCCLFGLRLGEDQFYNASSSRLVPKDFLVDYKHSEVPLAQPMGRQVHRHHNLN